MYRIHAAVTYLRSPYNRQPPYLHNLISVQRFRRTCSSSVATLARPLTLSSLKITDRSFVTLYLVSGINFLCLFVNLILVPVSLSIPNSHIPASITSSFHSPLCLYITPSLFHSRLNTYLFGKSVPCSFTSPPNCLNEPFLLSYPGFFFFSLFLFSVPCAR